MIINREYYIDDGTYFFTRYNNFNEKKIIINILKIKKNGNKFVLLDEIKDIDELISEITFINSNTAYILFKRSIKSNKYYYKKLE